MGIVELRDLTYKYPLTDSPALQNINLQVDEGEFVAIIGPNGSGKSTLCYAIAGFVPHFFKGEMTGRVAVAGKESSQSNLHEWVLNVGLAFQNPFNQISGAKYTVFEELAFGLENIGVPRDDDRLIDDAEGHVVAGLVDLLDPAGLRRQRRAPVRLDLVEDLADRSMLDNVLVIAMSEFGRTPRINGHIGRDHWPEAWSLAMAGCGLKRGTVVGKTNEFGTFVDGDEHDIGAMFHTWFHCLESDTSKIQYDNAGQPVPLAHDEVEPVKELLA